MRDWDQIVDLVKYSARGGEVKPGHGENFGSFNWYAREDIYAYYNCIACDRGGEVGLEFTGCPEILICEECGAVRERHLTRKRKPIELPH